MMSVDLSITITAAVPSDEPTSLSAVEIHQRVAHLLARHAGHRGAARDDRQQIVPAAADAAAMLLDHLLERDAHRLFEGRRACSHGRRRRRAWCRCCWRGRCRRTRRRRGAGFPAPTAIDLDVVDGRRAAVDAHRRRERRLQPRQALLALERFQQRGLFAADIGAGAVMDDDVEVPAVDVVLADQPRVIGLLDGGLEALRARG